MEPEYERATLFCRKLCGDRDRADDLLQDAMVKAMTKFSALRDNDSFRPWLYRILISTFRDSFKRPWWQRRVSLTPEMKAEHAVTFAVYAESAEELQHVRYLAESIREFAGRFREAPIWVYMPESFTAKNVHVTSKLDALGVEIRISHAPEESQRFYYAGKTFASGMAKTAAEGKSTVLVWLDEDTIVLREPADFLMSDSIHFAYRPVMHNRSGTLYGQPPNKFWSRIYDRLAIDDSLLFPMVTPADQQTINAYFNAGLLVVRPERGILRAWAADFKVLYEDSVLAKMCDDDITNKIFLHQTALVGAVLHRLGKDEMVELSLRYNYPIFFHQQYEAASEFESIEDVVTLRYDLYFRNPARQWAAKLKGDPHKIAWLKKRL